MYWEFDIAYEAEPKDIIDKNGNISTTKGRYKYCLKDKDGDRCSSYYDKIVYLGNNHFAVATYEPQIVTLNKNSKGVIVEPKASAADVKLKWGVIKMYKCKINKYDLWRYITVIPPIYNSILPNNDNTITVEYENKKTFVELDENSDNYGKQLYPCLFDNVSNYDLDYKGFVNVKFNDKTGYIPRNIVPNNYRLDLLSVFETKDLIKYINGEISELDFDIRYKYMCMTNETPMLTRILKNKDKN